MNDENGVQKPQNGVRSTYRRLKVGKIGKINGKKGVRDNFGAATGVVKLSPFMGVRQSRAISLGPRFYFGSPFSHASTTCDSSMRLSE